MYTFDEGCPVLTVPRQDEGDASEMEVDGIVAKTPASAMSEAPRPPSPSPAPMQTQIQIITDEMSRLFQAPAYKTTDEVPEKIHEHLQSLTRRQLLLANARSIFEAKMAAAEPRGAPPIRVYNPIEGDTDPCPAFEFIYSNEMWYDGEVGPPNYEDLRGCDCEGGCDPKSETCACRVRQEYWSGPGARDQDNNRVEGFAYDNEGRTRVRSFPHFECNWKCGCDESCQNRVSLAYSFEPPRVGPDWAVQVVQKGRQYELHIVKTAEKGWGKLALPMKIRELMWLL
jgi:histone-lysine N-methyltransferase SUV39H